MLLVNFEVSMGAEDGQPAWLATCVGALHGRAAATFVVLAGIGVALLSRRSFQLYSASGETELLARDRRRLFKRALFLFAIGLSWADVWEADILHFYGVYLLCGAFMLGLSARQLLIATGAIVLAFVPALLFLNYDAGWNWETYAYEGFWTWRGMLRNLFFNGWHPALPWTAFLIFGMALGRMDLRQVHMRKRVGAWGLGIALAGTLCSKALVYFALQDGLDDETAHALFGTEMIPPMPLYMLTSGGTAAFVIALSVEIGERHQDSRWLRPLLATGQLALTLYFAHVLLGLGVLEAVGRLERQSLVFASTSAAIFSCLAVAFSHLWRKRFKQGPVEALMRKLSS